MVVNLLRSWGWFAQRTAPMQAGIQPEGFPDVAARCLLLFANGNDKETEPQLNWKAEVKFRDRMPSFDDVLKDGKKYGTNIVFHKRTHKPMMVTMEADYFMVIMSNFVRPIKQELEKEDGEEDSGSEVA